MPVQEYIQQHKEQYGTPRTYSTASRYECPNAEEAEENDFKNNFMKMMGALKKEMKNSIKEIKNKANKNWKK